VLEGCQKIAGEWGHNPLYPNGLPCYCGKRGCVETVISGPALEGYYHSLTGHKMSLKEIYNLSRQDAQSEAKATIAHLVKNFSKAIAAVINILDPHMIVLGGGVGNIDELYSETCRREIEKHLFYDRLNTQILKPKLGDSAGVFGAACLTL
jgi:N-acetylglucosamine kinase